MKKNKSKSKSQSGDKKLKKELALKLITAFDEVVNQYGEAKKSKKIIENFAKRLAKTLSKHKAASPVKETVVAEKAKAVESKPSSPEKTTAPETVAKPKPSSKPKTATKAK